MNNRIEKMTSLLDINKAEAIEVFDLRQKNYFVDYAIIASSLGSRHTLALLDHLKNGLKPEETFNNVDESGDWIVIDFWGKIYFRIRNKLFQKFEVIDFLP